MLVRRGRAVSEWRSLLPPLARFREGHEPQIGNSGECQTVRSLGSKEVGLSNSFGNFRSRAAADQGLRHDFGHFAGGLDYWKRRHGIATSAYCPAPGEGEEPVRSPLLQAPGPLGNSVGRKTAQAVLTGIRQSPKKLNLVAEMVRGMRVEDALTQMTVCLKRAAKTVYKVLHSAQANAVHNFGLSKDRLVVSEAFVGKDKYLKRLRPHGKGKSGKLEHPRARLTVIVTEMSIEQETDLARLRLLRRQGTRMSRVESRLVPHRVIETKWQRQRILASDSA